MIGEDVPAPLAIAAPQLLVLFEAKIWYPRA
jgi:hypothetical protein